MQNVASFGSMMMMTMMILVVIITTGQTRSYLPTRCFNFLPKHLMQEHSSVKDIKGNLYRRDNREGSYMRKIQSTSSGNWFGANGINLYYVLYQWMLLSKWCRETNLGLEKEMKTKEAYLNIILFLLYGDVRILMVVVRIEMKGMIREPF